tara:strand:- start:51 stop:296 length:246 start_codon:yes stop_codon:yes gene_type:complete
MKRTFEEQILIYSVWIGIIWSFVILFLNRNHFTLVDYSQFSQDINLNEDLVLALFGLLPYLLVKTYISIQGKESETKDKEN